MAEVIRLFSPRWRRLSPQKGHKASGASGSGLEKAAPQAAQLKRLRWMLIKGLNTAGTVARRPSEKPRKLERKRVAVA